MPDSITPYLFRVQTDPQGSAPVATAFFGEEVTVAGKVFKNDIALSVNWPLVSDKTVMLEDGTILSYSQISEGVTKIAYQERELKLNPPAPEPTDEEATP